MSYSSDLLQLPGATPVEGNPLAEGVAWHYGNPLAEQQGTRLIDRSHRRVIAVSGKDAAEFLHNLLSQKLVDVPSSFSASALDLDIQGHILHHADIALVDGTFYLDVPAAQFDSFADYLRKMVFWSEVTVEEADLAILTILAPDGEFPEVPEATFSRRVDAFVPARMDFAVPRDQALAVAQRLRDEAGVDFAGLMAFTAARVRNVEPELGVDLDEKSIPHEVPRLINRGEHVGAVHLNKGCYRGQETVARVENLGRSPRLLVMLQLDGSAPNEPQPGDTITANGRKVGRLGTVVHDADYGPIALALVKRSALEAPLDIDGVAASVDKDSLPTDEGEKLGRLAVEKLRRGQ